MGSGGAAVKHVSTPELTFQTSLFFIVFFPHQLSGQLGMMIDRWQANDDWLVLSGKRLEKILYY